MSNESEQTPAEEARGYDQNPTGPIDQAQEWEAMARAWLRAFPEAKAVSVTDVEAWIDVNHGCLPSELKSMARSELIEKLLSIQNFLRLPTQAPVIISPQQSLNLAYVPRTSLIGYTRRKK